MCLVLWAHDRHPRYRLILAANRDEFHRRPTGAASYWPDCPGVLGGRDLEAGGAWMAVNRNGRLAFLTNYRGPSTAAPGPLSRGRLVRDFVCGTAAPEAYLTEVHDRRGAYRDFNLIVVDGGRLWYLNSRAGRPRPVAPGIHGLSNHALDTPWPKVAGGKEELGRFVSADEVVPDALPALLLDRRRPDDSLLPDTGAGLEQERFLGPRFIVGSCYGTRSSTLLLVTLRGRATFCEWTFVPGADPPTVAGRRCFRMDLER